MPRYECRGCGASFSKWGSCKIHQHETGHSGSQWECAVAEEAEPESQLIESRICELVDSSASGRVLCSALPDLYRNRFGEKLVYEGKLQDALETMRSIAIYKGVAGAEKCGRSTVSSQREGAVAEEAEPESQLVESRICELVDSSASGRLLCGELFDLYRNTFGEKLVYEGKLKDALQKMRSIALYNDTGVLGAQECGRSTVSPTEEIEKALGAGEEEEEVPPLRNNDRGGNKYSCYECGENFAAWGPCLAHLRARQHCGQPGGSMSGLQQRCSVLRAPSSSFSVSGATAATRDGAVALACLERLTRRCGDGQPMPKSTDDLQREIEASFSATDAPEALVAWRENCRSAKAAYKSLAQSWGPQQLQCLFVKKKLCHWSKRKIREALASAKLLAGASRDDGDDDAPSLSLPGARDDGDVTASKKTRGDLRGTLRVVASADDLAAVIRADPALRAAAEGEDDEGAPEVVAIETVEAPCHLGSGEVVEVVAISTSRGTYVVGASVAAGAVGAALRGALENAATWKICHGAHRVFSALSPSSSSSSSLSTEPSSFNGGDEGKGSFLSFAPRSTFDTQLAYELLSGDAFADRDDMLHQLGVAKPDRLRSGGGARHRREVENAARTVAALVAAGERLRETLTDDQVLAVGAASDRRIEAALRQRRKEEARGSSSSGSLRELAFDSASGYRLASLELLEATRPADTHRAGVLVVHEDLSAVLDLLPGDIAAEVARDFAGDDGMSDVVLDLGRPALAWIGGARHLFLKGGRTVTAEDLEAVTAKLLGGFGSDNRAGLDRQLHRVSAMRNRQRDVIGLTLRVGRHVSGNADMITDVLLGDDGTQDAPSILFLGEPGSGKTTVVREATRLLAQNDNNVCVVDTSNEIAGDGDVPHACVGFARRMMVPSLTQQAAVMVECVQNHTPSVMVIDEIGRASEVDAARTVKQRGVRIVASAHGDLRKLVKNAQLRGLVGGVETVTLGDAAAAADAKSRHSSNVSKLKAQRGGAPTFDVIVELSRSHRHEWRVVLDVASAVDSILAGEQYRVQRRTRHPDTGALDVAIHYA